MIGKEIPVGAGEEDAVVVDYRISSSVLEAIVRWSLAGDGSLRLGGGGGRGGRNPIVVSVVDEATSVTVHLRARLGEDLLALGARVKRTVAGRLGGMTGLRIARVDVHVTGVFPPDEVEA